jgi:hypothetical protein
MRGRRRIPGLVIGTLLAAAWGPSAAAADVITFDHGAVKIAPSSSALTIVEPADPLEIDNVTYGPGDAFATSAAGDFDFTPHPGVFGGIGFTIDLAANAPVTGTFDPATGAMATDSIPFTVTVNVGPPDNATCTYTGPLSFSTENTQVILGDRFDPAGPPFLNGAVSTTWIGIPGDPDPGCNRINGYAKDPGGFWLSNGIATPSVVPGPPACPAAALAASAKAPCGSGCKKLRCLKRCKKGRVLKKGRCVKRKKKRKKKRGAGRRR